MADVIVYSTPSCPFCSMAKEYLNNNKIEFVDHDVSADREKAIEMIKKSGQRGVPVLDVKGNIIVGFRPEAINEAMRNPKVEREDFINNTIFDPFRN